MNRYDAARYLLSHPAELGRRLGYEDLRDELHGEWMNRMLQAKEDMTLQAHRGSYKTTCLTIVIALMLIMQRDKNIIFLRKTDSDVSEVILQVQRILSAPLMQQIYQTITGEPLTMIAASKSEITTAAYNAPRGASQLLGIGLGGSLTGKHADIVITDDIVNRLDRTSPAERERTRNIYQELQNIKNRSGRIINTGTPWHKQDAFELMPDPKRYDVYQTGIVSQLQIDKLRQSMSPSLFAANYELRHIASEQALFSEPPRFADDAELLRDGIAHIDAAYGGEDYTALTCAARIGDTIYLYGRLWQKHIDKVSSECIRQADRLLCAPVYCETNGDKGFFAKQLRRDGVQVRSYAEKMNKYAKIATYLRKWWSNIVFLRGTDAEYIDQIMDYTEDAEHDDAPDSAACVCRIFDRRGE